MPAPTATDVKPVGTGEAGEMDPAGQHESVASVPTAQETPAPPALTDVKVPAGGLEMFPGQHASVWSVLSAQAKPPPPLTAVNVPAGGGTGLAAAPNGAPQHASVWSVRTPHAWAPAVLTAVNV